MRGVARHTLAYAASVEKHDGLRRDVARGGRSKWKIA